MTVIPLKSCYKLCGDFITLPYVVLCVAVNYFLGGVLMLVFFVQLGHPSSVTMLCEHHHMASVFLGLWHIV